MKGKSVMTILGDPGDSRDYPLLHSLPACNQRKRVVEHGSVLPDGVSRYKGTWSDLMMHLSLLLTYVLTKRDVGECITSTKGMSVPYICTWSQMAHVGNVVLIVFSLAHNYF